MQGIKCKWNGVLGVEMEMEKLIKHFDSTKEKHNH
jgi:hypothetical protein